MMDSADQDGGHRDDSPQMPDPGDKMPGRVVAAPHPALLDRDELESQCDLRAQRRSGPGGQHRNKTSSGVFLLHQPTGVTSEATERRSQADNRSVALLRLRYRLAVEVRTASPMESPEPAVDPTEQAIRQDFSGKRLRVSDRNEAKPGVVALLLNDLHAAGGQPSLVAAWWKTSTSGIVAILKSHPPAFAQLNAIRTHHGRWQLK